MDDKPVCVSDRELKIAAALYATRPGVLEHVRATGELPGGLGPMGGMGIGARLLIERRGKDFELTEDEDLVLQAIRRAGRLPYGSVILIDNKEGRD